MHCPGGNATDLIWRVLASSLGISCWTPLKPQHSNPNPNPLANQFWCIDFLTPPTPLIIPHRLLPSLNLLYHSETDARFMHDGRKAVWSIPYVSVAFFPSLKHNFIAYRKKKQKWSVGVMKLYIHRYPQTKQSAGCPRGVMVKAMDCGIVVSEFELQSRYYVHFRANILGKGRNPLIPQLWIK